MTDTFLYRGGVFSLVALKGRTLFAKQQFALQEALSVGEVSSIACQDLYQRSIQGGKECS
jgi:hypothetical protein